MKKILFLATMLLMVVGVSAQENKFSVKAGIGVAKVAGDVDGDMRLSYKVGVGYEFGITENFGIEPSIMFNAKGSGDASLYYLEVPIMAAAHINSFTINVGPYVAYGIAATEDFFDYEDANKFDVGFGAGFKYNFGKFAVGADCSYGLTKVIKEISSPNITFGLTLGYSF